MFLETYRDLQEDQEILEIKVFLVLREKMESQDLQDHQVGISKDIKL